MEGPSRVPLALGAWIDLGTRRLVRGSYEVALTGNEARLIAHLAERANQVVGWEELEQHVWRQARGVTSRAPYFAWRRLVHKVEPDPDAPANLHTVHGDGVRYVAPDDVVAPGAARSRVLLTSFVGREPELAAVRGALARGVRWITVAGTGGAGKTRLLLELGIDVHPGWVWRELAGCRTNAQVGAAIARAAGLPSDDDLGAFLRTARRGLVLDGVEAAIDPTRSRIEQWCLAVPELRVVVTSRRALGGAGEHVVPIGPMPLDDALALFAARAIAVDPRFDLEAARDDAAAVIAAVDGLPLGIELAAARVSLGVLSTHRVPGLEATVAWSWLLLSASEQQALEELAVFRGGATEAAVAAVVTVPPGLSTIDVLEGLVQHNLVTVDLGGSEPRYAPYATVAAFGAERLARRSDVDAVQHRHAAWFARVGTYRRAGDPALRAERQNLEAAYAHAPDDPTAIEIGLRAIAAYSAFGPLPEALAVCADLAPRAASVGWFHALRAHALGYSGHHDDARAAYVTAVDLAGGDRELLAIAHRGIGTADMLVEDGASAEQHLDASLAIWRELGSIAEEVRTACVLTVVASRRGAWSQAERLARAALVRAREGRDRQGEIAARGQVARLQLLTGDPVAAELSLRALLEAGPSLQSAHNLAVALLFQRRFAEAREALQSAVDTSRSSGRPADLIEHLALAAQIALEEGDEVGAETTLAEASAIAAEIGLTDHTLVAMRGVVAARAGRFGDARSAIARVGQSYADQAIEQAVWLLLSLAEIHHRIGDPSEAQAALDSAEQVATRSGVQPSALHPAWDRVVAMVRG